MDRLYRASRIREEPLIAVSWIIGLAAIVGGFLVLSLFTSLGLMSLTSPGGGSALYQTAASSWGLIALAVGGFTTGGMIIYGIKKSRKWLVRGLFGNFLLRVYAVLVQLFVFGWNNSMLASVTLVFITLIVYIALRTGRH